MLERAGLAEMARRSVRELSHGQRRRAVLAAAWIGRPRLLLLDEPFEAMDGNIRSEVLAWIENEVAGGAAAVVAAHTFEELASRASAALTIGEGGRPRLQTELPGERRRRLAILATIARGQVQ
jgi:ABC-type molybdenum transport system ATPase subunit/photorepair protein PhrA